jgi:predicted small secreted protein
LGNANGIRLLLPESIDWRAMMLNRRLAATLLLPLILLGACNTTEGMGKDVQSAGKELEKAADENK